MKQAIDKYTRDMFDKPVHGRTRTLNQKSTAQRLLQYRQREKLISAIVGMSGEK